MPSAVTPWLTAFKAYSVRRHQYWVALRIRCDSGVVRRLAITDRSAPACRCGLCQYKRIWVGSWGCAGAYLGEKVVRENEYLSAMTAN